MAPEINGEDSYEGPPQDLFALGQVLFMIHTTKFAFSHPGDVFYKRLHRDAETAMKSRNLKVDCELLDLVVGMTRTEVEKRYTLDQVIEHKYL